MARYPFNSHIFKMLLFIILITSAQILEAIIVNKCCDQDQVFDQDLSCVSHNTSTNWTFNDINNVQFKYNVQCAALKEYKNVMVQSLNGANFTEDGLVEYDGNIYITENFCVEDMDLDDDLEAFVFMCPCSNHGCINKCCHKDHHMVDSGDNEHICEINKPEQEDWQYKSPNETNLTMAYMIPECEGDESLYVILGNMKFWDSGILESDTDGIFQPQQYCGDYLVTKDKTLEPVFYGCLKNREPTDWVYLILSAINAAFLVVTALVLYLWSPKNMWLISKLLVWHTLSSAVASGTLVMGQLHVQSNELCVLLAFIMQFSFLASFLWLNVISYEIAMRVFVKKFLNFFRNMSSSKKYIWYSAYSWGCAIAITIITIIVEFSGLDKDSMFKPNFGVIKCWFRESTALWIYFYIPMSTIICINFVLYLCNAYAIMTSKTLMLRLKSNNGKLRRFMTCFKLFLLVGITWALELLSWNFNSKYLAWDILNLLRGVIIFMLFGWKIIKNKFWNKSEDQDEFTQIYLSISPSDPFHNDN